jgi:hypothetical protein
MFAFGCGRTARVVSVEREKPSNLDLLVEVVRSVGAELTTVAEIDSSAVLRLRTYAPSDELARFFETVVASELQRSGYRLIEDEGADPARVNDGENVYRLDLTLLSLGVLYSDRRGDGLFQQPSVERKVRVRVAAKFSSPQGRILWAGERKAEVQDRLSVAQLPAAEADAPGFARGEVPAAGGLLRTVLEPVALATAAGAVIYFFFTFRN